MTVVDANAVAFQGAEGAYSEIVCARLFPDRARLACPVFEDVFRAVGEGRAGIAVIPIENARAGRVAGIHDLLPESNLRIIGEVFQEVRHALLAPKGASLKSLRRIHSHEQALSQCRTFLRDNNLEPVRHADTAGAARDIAQAADIQDGALASPLAAKIYNLETLLESVQDEELNITRFLVLAAEEIPFDPNCDAWITSLFFRLRSVPAALYKALGGFATNGINITKLESYIVDSHFTVAQFYLDIEGQPRQESLRLALEELSFYSSEVKILGIYPASPFRKTGKPESPFFESP